MLHLPDSVTNSEKKDTGDHEVSIIFAGDIMLAREIEEKIEDTTINYPFKATKEYLETADYRVGNLECVLSEKGELIEGRTMPFRANPKFIQGLKYSQFNLLTLANNHILDYGPEALNDTIELLNDNNIKMTGIYAGEIINFSSSSIERPIIFKKNGLEFAFISYAHDPPIEWSTLNSFYEPIPLNNSVIDSEINYIKKLYPNAIIIVQIHWRIQPQYSLTHNSFQQEICHGIVDAGATIVSCHGPHTIQEIEAYKSIDGLTDGLILYSLGNYVFDLSNEDSLYSFLVKTTFKAVGIETVALLPIYRQNYQYEPAGKEKSYTYESDLFLDWSDYEELFTFRVNNPVFCFNFGTVIGVVITIPLYIFIINKIKKREIQTRKNKL